MAAAIGADMFTWPLSARALIAVLAWALCSAAGYYDGAMTIPKPLRATPNEPYRYGVLAHPFPFSLGDLRCSAYNCIGGDATLQAGSRAQVELMCRAAVRFVRIDYPAALILVDGSGKRLLTKPNFVREDAIMDALAKCGITELPVILQYATGAVLAGGKGGSTPFQYPAQTGGLPGYADFARVVAAHVTAKYPQITRVELFNEPNQHGWGTFPVGGSYASSDESGSEAAIYMKAAYAAVKRVNPHLIVVGPALSDGGRSTDARSFLRTMYANGCRRGRCWDVLSVHNYYWGNPDFPVASSSPSRFDVYKDLQRIATERGDPRSHVMLTEWGYSTDEKSPDAVDPQVQAQYLALGFNRMLADPSVDGVAYVNMYNPGSDFWANTALVRKDFTPKPAFYVFRAFSRYQKL